MLKAARNLQAFNPDAQTYDKSTEKQMTERNGGGREHETYQMGDIVSRRCFSSAQGLIKDETCTERSGPFRPVRLCAAWK